MARPKLNDGLTDEQRRKKRIAEDPEYAARYAEQRRKAALAYYHRNRERVNREANERQKAKRAAEGRTRGPKLTREERLARNAERRAAKRRAAGIPEKVTRTPEERREYYRQWAMDKRRRMGALPRAEYLAMVSAGREERGNRARAGQAPSRVLGRGGWEALESAEHRRRSELSAAYGDLEGELAEIVAEQAKEDRLDGRYGQSSWTLSLDARTFDDGDEWTNMPKALTEPDFSEDLLERIR